MRELRVFLSSFLVLFLEVALIRWLPAQVRLLSYFANFILLGCFLGIGVGCLLSRSRRDLFTWFPLLLAVLVGAVAFVRIEVAVPTSTEIFFSSGTSGSVLVVESIWLLPVLFLLVAALFAALAQRMAREMESLPPLRSYTLNILGSLLGCGGLALISWLEMPPAAWFGTAVAAALPLLFSGRRLAAFANVALLTGCLVVLHVLARGATWSPYYKVVLRHEGPETVLEVNNIFHQSMAAPGDKEYFYEWPYTVFKDSFDDVLILGAGSGTDVAAALAHGAKHVDAVEIDPAILRLGKEHHPSRPYWDDRVTVTCDDARHYLRTTERKYDLVVFALIDSLTVQSSFSSVRLESYMFTEESFRAVRDRLKPNGLLVVYNYFREPWLVDRLAGLAARAFGTEPKVHVHERSAWLGVMMAGPRADALADYPPIPDRVGAYGHEEAASPGRIRERDRSVVPSTDDWPFLYMHHPHLPRHYLAVVGLVLLASILAVLFVLRGNEGTWSWNFFFLGAGFMLLETKSIIQFALLWGSTWVVASFVIGSILVMALAANLVVSRVEVRRTWVVTLALLVLLGANHLLPLGTIGFESRALESVFYAALVFSPVFCAGLLFGSAIRVSRQIALDYGANLLGAMVGGVAEYLALVTGYGFLLLLVGVFYLLAQIARRTGR